MFKLRVRDWKDLSFHAYERTKRAEVSGIVRP